MAMTLRADKGAILSWNEMDANFRACLGVHNLLHVQDQKDQGTHGGTFTTGAWRTRTLNTVLLNAITGASLSSNQILLPAGSYYIDADLPCFHVIYYKTRLYDITTGAKLITGTGGLLQNTDNVSGSSIIRGLFSLPSAKSIELQHNASYTVENTGLGVASSLDTEIYTDVRIWKLS